MLIFVSISFSFWELYNYSFQYQIELNVSLVCRLGTGTSHDTQRRSLGHVQRVLETNSQSRKRAHNHTHSSSKGWLLLLLTKCSYCLEN